MTKNTFDPTWRELLRPTVLPSKKPEKKPTREPFITNSYVHLAIKFVDHPNDFSKKLQIILDKHVNTKSNLPDLGFIDDERISSISNYFKIPLKPCRIINKDDSNLIIDIEKYKDKVLTEMPAKEYVEYGVIVQTFNLDFPDVYSDCYKKRINEIVPHFIDTLVCDGKIRGTGLIQVFLYVHNNYTCKSRLFTQYSKSSSNEYISAIVNDFIVYYNSLDELQLIIELLFLNNYNLSITISSNFERLLLETLQKRIFFTAIKEFLSSPIIMSATHGLQYLCKEIIINILMKSHANLLINEIVENYNFDLRDIDKLGIILHDVCNSIFRQ